MISNVHRATSFLIPLNQPCFKQIESPTNRFSWALINPRENSSFTLLELTVNYLS